MTKSPFFSEDTPRQTPPEVIAEIGTAHEGSLSLAKELIHAAAEAGADTIKFQYVLADEIIHPRTGDVPLPGGRIPLFQRFKDLEAPPEFYQTLKEECEKRGAAFLCTPFGSRSLAHLLEIGVSRLKIASPELNHLPLLKEAKESGLPLLLSTGVSRLREIEEAMEIVDGAPVTLFHCITSYPAPEEEYNLNLLPGLALIFGVPLGISDHSLDPLLVPLLGAARGAVAVEKHFTLNRSRGGLDDPIALEPQDFALMTAELKKTAGRTPREIQNQLEECAGAEKISRILGTGIKRPAPSEKEHYGRTNRSLHSLKALTAGHYLQPEDLAILRTEKILRPGLPPWALPLVLGTKLTRDLPPGEGLVWKDLLTVQ